MIRGNNRIAAGSYYARKRNRTETAIVDDTFSPAWGTIAFATNPSNTHTITINGTVITFGTTVTVGPDLPTTLASVLAYLATHPIAGATVSRSGNGLLIQSAAPADTSVTLAASNATVSSGNLQKQKVNARVPFASLVGARPYSSQAQQFFDRLITPPAPTRATLYAALVDTLVPDGTWGALDGLLTLAAADSGTSLINLKQAAFQGVTVHVTGFPTFTPDVGWNGTGAGTAQTVSFFNPSTEGQQYTRNNAMICGWQIGNAREALFVDDVGGGSNEVWPQGVTNTYWAVNSNNFAEIPVPNPPSNAGFWLVQRTASNACAVYQNNALFNSSGNPSGPLNNGNIVLGTRTNTALAIGWGAALTSGQQTTLYTALQTYLHAIGAV